MTVRQAAVFLFLPFLALSSGCGGCGAKVQTVEQAQAIVQSKFPSATVTHKETKQGEGLSQTEYHFWVNYQTGTDATVRADGSVFLRGPVPLEVVPDRHLRDAKTVLKTQTLSGAEVFESGGMLNRPEYTLFADLDGGTKTEVKFLWTGEVLRAKNVPYPWDKVTPAQLAQADERHRGDPLTLLDRDVTWDAARWSRHESVLGIGKAGDRLTLSGKSARGQRVSVEIDTDPRSREDLGLPPIAP
jgi:hypothetical protein